MKKIERSDLEALLFGSQFLGSGGGGKSHILKQLIRNRYEETFSVDLIEADELARIPWGSAVGMVGSPEVAEEYLPTGQEGKWVLNQLATLTGRESNMIFTIEGAGVNLIYPLIVAYATGLPLVDGDVMGRAFPEMQMTTFQFNDQPASPIIFKDAENQSYVFENQEASVIDLQIRQKIMQSVGLAFFSGYQISGEELRKILIPGTYTFARRIGEAFLESDDYGTLLSKLEDVTRNSIYGTSIELVKGPITEVNKFEKSNISSYSVGELTLYYQNENLVAYRNKNLVASVPDLITLIDLERLEPVSVVDIQVGMNVAVLGTPSPLHLRTPRALSVVGPKAFGFKSAYEPLERIYFKHYY